jgi:hypothetical protein
MKCTLLLLVIFYSISSARAQDVALSSYTAYVVAQPYEKQNLTLQPRHCKVMRIGNRVMITGGAVAVVGALGLLTPWAKDNDPGYSSTGTNTATALVVGGVSLALVGVVLHIVGQEYEDKHPRHLSVTSEKNKIGMAWNF